MAGIQGFGAFVPARVVGNEEIGALSGAAPDWILSVSGIEERHFAGADETVADLATAAAKDCLERCGLEAAALGMILVASGTQVHWNGNFSTHPLAGGVVPTKDPSSPISLASAVGGQVSVTFSNAGEYPYFCQVHFASMDGVIYVQ